MNHVIGYCDIEVVDDKIVCVGFSTNKKFYTFTFDESFSIAKKVDDVFFSEAYNCVCDWKIFYAPNEEEMLKMFKYFVENCDIDYFAGWYFYEFDADFILSKMKHYKIHKEKRHSRLFNRQVIDLYKCFLRVKRSGIRSAKLSSVAKECGYKNYLYFPNKIPMLWQSNKQRLLLMNIVHVDALIYVDNSMNLSEFVLDVANLSGTNIADVHSSYHIITSFFMMNKNPNIVLPTSENGEREDYEGAVVLEPKEKFAENVLVFDLNRLYPSIIISFNLSPETLIHKQNKKLGLLWDFRKDIEGIVPQITRRALELREKYKGTKLYQPTKEIINSIYGVIAVPSFALYEKRIPQTVTAIGRKILLMLKEFAEKNGYDVLYGDTDSLMIKANTNDFVSEGEMLKEMFDDELKNFVAYLEGEPEELSIDFEKVYSKAIFSTKKRYAGWVIYEDGKEESYLDVKGFEYRRGDSSIVTKRVQENILTMILRDGKSANEILKYVYEEIENFKKNKLYEIARPVGLSKDLKSYGKHENGVVKQIPIHAKAVMYSNAHLGYNFKAGDKVYLLYVNVNTKMFPPTDVIAIDEFTETLPAGIEVDWNKMIEKTIIDKIEEYIELFGIDRRVLKSENRNLEVII